MHLYRFKNESGDVLYIGKTINLKKRIRSHFIRCENISLVDYEGVFSVDAAEVANRADLDILEIYLINKIRPNLNTANLHGIKPSFSIEYPLVWERVVNREQIIELLNKRKSVKIGIDLGDDWVLEEAKKYSLFDSEIQLLNLVYEFMHVNAGNLTPIQRSVLTFLLDNSLNVLGVTVTNREAIASELNCSRVSIIRACRRLEELGIIKQDRLTRPYGGSGPCAIYFIPDDDKIGSDNLSCVSLAQG